MNWSLRAVGRISIVVVVVGGIAALVSGCAEPDLPGGGGVGATAATTTATSATSTEPPSFRLPQAIDFTDMHLHVKPVDVDTVTHAPVEVAEQGIGAVMTLDPSFRPYLVSVTDDDMGEIQPDNSVILFYTDRLAWMFMSTGPCNAPALGGPIQQSAEPTTAAPTDQKSVALWFADGVTGAYLFGASSCTPA